MTPTRTATYRGEPSPLREIDDAGPAYSTPPVVRRALAVHTGTVHTGTVHTGTVHTGAERSVTVRALCMPVRAYQLLRAGRPSPCRYWPTCSTYTLEALATHGPRRGLGLAARRMLRCHPWSRSSGVDPVPAARTR